MLTKYNYNQLFLGAAAIAAAGLGFGLMQPATSHADTLVWSGAAGTTGSAAYGTSSTNQTGTVVSTALWDGTTANWNDSTSGATGVAYSDGSNVTFNGTGANTNITIGNVTAGGGVTPGSVSFTGGSGAYQFFDGVTAPSGGGYPAAPGIQGSGSLTLASGFTGSVMMAVTSSTSYNAGTASYVTTTVPLDNSYSGGTYINGGTLSARSYGNTTMNYEAFGTGSITFGGASHPPGTLELAVGAGTGAYAPTLANNIVVNADSTGRIIMGTRETLGVNAAAATSTAPAVTASTISGSGTLLMEVSYVRDNFAGDWSGFTGNLNVVPNSAFTGAENFWFDGMSSTAGLSGFDLAGTMDLIGTGTNGVTAGWNNDKNAAYGYVVQLGGLSGNQYSEVDGAHYGAGNGNLHNLEYVVGGNNQSTTFAGKLAAQTALSGQITDLYKVGTGTLTLTGPDTFGGITEINSGTLVVDNTLQVDDSITAITPGVVIDAPNTAVTTEPNKTGNLSVSLAPGTGGTLAGIGTILIASSTAGATTTNATITDNGILQPGDPASSSVGTLTVDGNVAINGTLAIGVGGSGSSDVLDVALSPTVTGTGNLVLGANSELSLSSLTGAFDGSAYTIATVAGTLSGTFGSVVGLPSNYSVHYGSNSITLSTAAVPEPATLGLFGIAGLGLLLLRRRRTA